MRFRRLKVEQTWLSFSGRMERAAAAAAAAAVAVAVAEAILSIAYPRRPEPTHFVSTTETGLQKSL
jgi:hypothetical protein